MAKAMYSKIYWALLDKKNEEVELGPLDFVFDMLENSSAGECLVGSKTEVFKGMGKDEIAELTEDGFKAKQIKITIEVVEY